MAATISNQGLQRNGDRWSSTSDAASSIFLQTMVIDGSATAFAASTVNINTATFAAAAFNATPTRASQTVSHISTYGTGTFNGNTIARISLHDRASGSVTSSSSTFFGGIDGQSLAKNSTFAITITLRYTNTSA